MNKNFFKFFLNYMPNIAVIVFICLILILVSIAIIDATLGSQVNAPASEIIFPVISYTGAFVIVASVVQWIANIILLSKADIDKEAKSKWRYFMFLFFITLARKPQPFKAGDEGCPERSGGQIAFASSYRNHGL